MCVFSTTEEDEEDEEDEEEEEEEEDEDEEDTFSGRKLGGGIVVVTLSITICLTFFMSSMWNAVPARLFFLQSELVSLTSKPFVNIFFFFFHFVLNIFYLFSLKR